MTLKELAVDHCARIQSVGGEGALRQHFLDMGVLPGAYLKVTKLAPMGDPMEIRIHDYELTLRLADADQITIEPVEKIPTQHEHKSEIVTEKPRTAHPGLGEDGVYHSKKDENPLPDKTILTYALMGNQNCGKTTLFNRLTGSNQHVGNFPGVTVDRKDGQILEHPETVVTDLPGIYSMSPYTAEEIVSRNFVLKDSPKAIINIVDATNIERNLYLTMQLIEMNIPMVVALNMMDEVTGNGGGIDVNAMERMLGVPVVPISAAKNQGVSELIKHAIHIAHYQERPLRQDFCLEEDHNGAVHRCIHAVIHLIEDHASRASLPIRFATTKVIEGDHLVLEALALDQNEKEMLEHIIIQMEAETGMDRAAAMADMRYDFIRRVVARSVVKPHQSKERIRSEKIDKILTGKYTAIPLFILIMGLTFVLTFNVIGAFLQSLMEMGIDKIKQTCDVLLIQADVNPALHSLIIDGVFEGVGSVLSFMPIIVTMFFFLSILEDSGYIARVAFFMDKLMRKIGLSGRSIVPLLIGFGCSVPAVMSTRTLPSARDRKMTVLLTPFMSCTAKLPIYAFLTAVFFPNHGGLVMTALYFTGIAVGIISAFAFKSTMFKGEAVPFVMELPNYRFPSWKNVRQLIIEKAKDFIQKAFSVILVAAIVVWFLQSFDLRLNLVTDSSSSIMAALAGILVPLFRPIGLGDWRLCTALITGFMAKESVVSTIGILYGNTFTQTIAIPSAVSLLSFCLLYTPCVATVAAVRRELGRLWALWIIAGQSMIAWLVAMLAYRLAGGFCSFTLNIFDIIIAVILLAVILYAISRINKKRKCSGDCGNCCGCH